MSHLEQQSLFLYTTSFLSHSILSAGLDRPAGVVRGIGMTQDV
jgi:hypothetical protein